MTVLSRVRSGSRESRCDRNVYDTDIKSVDTYANLIKQRERLKKDVETLVCIQLKTEFCFPLHSPSYDNDPSRPTSRQCSSARREFINKNANGPKYKEISGRTCRTEFRNKNVNGRKCKNKNLNRPKSESSTLESKDEDKKDQIRKKRPKQDIRDTDDDSEIKTSRTKDQNETTCIQTKRLISVSTLTSEDNRRSEILTPSVTRSGGSNYHTLTNLPIILCCQPKSYYYNESNSISLYDDKINFNSGKRTLPNNDTIDSDFEHNDDDYHSDHSENSIGVIHYNSFSSEDEQDNEVNVNASTMELSKPPYIDKHDHIKQRARTVDNTRVKGTKDMTSKRTEEEYKKEIDYIKQSEKGKPIYPLESPAGASGTMRLVTSDQLGNNQDIANEIIGRSQYQAGKQEIDDYKKNADIIARTVTMYFRGRRIKITYDNPMYKI